MLGLTIATVIGAPSATWIGQFIGWQVAFFFVGIVSLVCCFLIWKFLPPVSNIAKTSILTN
ncbi:MFS transporter, DHA1 family, inner membrane transport protein [Bartonella sp. AR 15-3]|nr:MFS transporter, DHA1 family, inner membrane transport protein [Bartonella sp. AR 15-3]